MKRGKKIALLAVVLLLAAVGLAAFWQRNNLAALRLAGQSQEALLEQMEDSSQGLADTARDEAGITIRDLTDEEKQALKDDPGSREDLIDRLVSDSAGPDKPDKPETPKAPDSHAALRRELDRCIAELYVMQAEYTGWLEQAHQAAIDEYTALPPEKHTTAGKYKVGLKYLNLAKEKEQECDNRIAELEKTIKGLLQQLGESTRLVNEIHSAYLNEKALKKAYYLGKHN